MIKMHVLHNLKMRKTFSTAVHDDLCSLRVLMMRSTYYSSISRTSLHQLFCLERALLLINLLEQVEARSMLSTQTIGMRCSAIAARCALHLFHSVCNWIFYAPNTSKVRFHSHFAFIVISFALSIHESLMVQAPKSETNSNTYCVERCW